VTSDWKPGKAEIVYTGKGESSSSLKIKGLDDPSLKGLSPIAVELQKAEQENRKLKDALKEIASVSRPRHWCWECSKWVTPKPPSMATIETPDDLYLKDPRPCPDCACDTYEDDSGALIEIAKRALL
jgi:hypothetical protein